MSVLASIKERVVGLVKRVFNIYEAARLWSPARSYIPHLMRDARYDINQLTRWEIARKARYFEANSALVNRLVDLFEQYTVGASGLRLVPASSDEEWNKRAAQWWEEWCRFPDIASRQNFATLQSLIAREWFVDGEVFVLLTKGGNAPPGMPQRPRIQLFESHRVQSSLSQDQRIADGVEIDENGRPLYYHVSSSMSGSFASTVEYQRVAADSIVHIFEPSRIGQYRGLSFLYPVMNDLHDLEDLQMLEMTAAKEAAAVTNVITNQAGEVSAAQLRAQRYTVAAKNSAGDTGTDSKQQFYQTVVGGRTVVLRNGDKFEQFKSDRPGVAQRDYWDYLIAKVCAGVGISKQLVFAESMQGTVTRADLDVANTFFRARSEILAAHFERIYAYVIGWARNNEERLKGAPEDWAKVNVRPPRSVDVDVGRNSKAMLEELKSGVRTLEGIYLENGEDWREQLRQKAKEAKYMDDLAAEFGIERQRIADLALSIDKPGATEAPKALEPPTNRLGLLVTNGPTGTAPSWFEVKNADASTGPVDILIYAQVGKDYWSGEGVGAKDFSEALAKIPKDRAINVRINSPGGNVWDGLTITNQLRARGDKVTCYVDGVAASIASIIALAGCKTVMARNALMMIHNPSALCVGSAQDMRKMADVLDTHKKSLVGEYKAKTNRQDSEIESKMDDETWFTADEAKAFGLCDEVGEEMSVTAQFDFSNFRRVPEALRAAYKPANKPAAALNAGADKQDKHTMTRDQILALLQKWGVTVENDATDIQLSALVEAGPPKASQTKPQEPTAPAQPADLVAQVQALQQANAAERKLRLGSEIDKLVAEERVPANQRDEWLNRAIADESILATLRNLPKAQRQDPISVSVVDADCRNIIAGINKANEAVVGWNRGNSVSASAFSNAARERGAVIIRNMPKIAEVWNTNTVDTALKRQVILQQAIVDFVRRISPLRQFATVFSSVPLEGTDKIDVPFYDLDTTTPTDWVANTGYETDNTTTDKREIQINKRKYLGGNFTSSDLARQPFLNVSQLMTLKAQMLAYTVWADVLSVVTEANYGSASKTTPASAFSSDDIADMKVACKTWPEMGRSLFLESSYDGNLLKDTAFKYALNAASDLAIKEGRLFPRVYGFDYIENPNIPTNSENLVGFAAFMSAILYAQAPIPPDEAVRRAGTMYDMIVDPQTGATFETRSFGSNTLDSATYVVECNYGYAKGNANALKRITSA